MPEVAVIMGSASDEDKVRPCLDIFDKLGIEYMAAISSAHRTPERTSQIVDEAEKGGVRVFICAAGMAAHLAGAVAARTIYPVIGIPIAASSLGGMDALLSTVQMPPGFPVATVALDKAGAKNAAWLAVSILATGNQDLRTKLEEARAAMRRDVEAASRKFEQGLKKY